ncbi:MAG: hypothetical protein GY940_42835 [bacterium]|nr:hypothetical protein [bacterium]
MEINFTPAALTQLELLGTMRSNATGFIIGGAIGTTGIVEELFPVHFDKTTIHGVYEKMYNSFGDQLMGVFFNGGEPFDSDWFIEDIVMTFNDAPPEFYYYDAEKKYVPLTPVTI